MLVNQASRYIEEIKAIKGDKGNDYGQDYMKIKFNSGNGLPLNKPLKLHAMTIIIKSVFEKGGKLYPQVFFRRLFVWVIRMEINIRQMSIKNHADYVMTTWLLILKILTPVC